MATQASGEAPVIKLCLPPSTSEGKYAFSMHGESLQSNGGIYSKWLHSLMDVVLFFR